MDVLWGAKAQNRYFEQIMQTKFEIFAVRGPKRGNGKFGEEKNKNPQRYGIPPMGWLQIGIPSKGIANYLPHLAFGGGCKKGGEKLEEGAHFSVVLGGGPKVRGCRPDNGDCNKRRTKTIPVRKGFPEVTSTKLPCTEF